MTNKIKIIGAQFAWARNCKIHTKNIIRN